MNWTEILAAAVTLFLVMDPLGNVPLFHAILSKLDPKKRAMVVARELLIALSILLVFLFAGDYILQFLGLSNSSLNIAGGILLFIISLRMIFPKPRDPNDPDMDDPFIVPLAIPMVAGPSTIAVLLLFRTGQPELIGQWSIALLLAWGSVTLILVTSPFIMQLIGNRGSRALERLMGMVLVLLATQMLLNGMQEFVANLVN